MANLEGRVYVAVHEKDLPIQPRTAIQKVPRDLREERVLYVMDILRDSAYVLLQSNQIKSFLGFRFHR